MCHLQNTLCQYRFGFWKQQVIFQEHVLFKIFYLFKTALYEVQSIQCTQLFHLMQLKIISAGDFNILTAFMRRLVNTVYRVL
jgi:hypothetical protein